MTDNLLIYVCAIAGQAPEWIQILPLGTVELRDSREPFEVDRAALEAIIARFTKEGVDLVVDYEHQSLGTDKAPAAGWIQVLQARADGLYAKVEWTVAARQHIEAGEYRYYSPVLKMEVGTRRPLALMHMGLTNTPAMTQLAPLLAAKYGEGGKPEIFILKSSQAETSASQKQEEATAMLKKLILKLGLKPEATEDEVLALVVAQGQEAVALKIQAAVLPEIAVALGLEKTADAAAITGTILALKQGTEQFSTLRTELEALKAEHVQGKAQAAVDEALAAKKIPPAQTEWALKLATEKPESFAAFVAAAVPLLPNESFKIPTKDGKGEVILTADEMTTCKALGVSAEAFKAEKDKQAAA